MGYQDAGFGCPIKLLDWVYRFISQCKLGDHHIWLAFGRLVYMYSIYVQVVVHGLCFCTSHWILVLHRYYQEELPDEWHMLPEHVLKQPMYNFFSVVQTSCCGKSIEILEICSMTAHVNIFLANWKSHCAYYIAPTGTLVAHLWAYITAHAISLHVHP